jgi:hypothetical protein
VNLLGLGLILYIHVTGVNPGTEKDSVSTLPGPLLKLNLLALSAGILIDGISIAVFKSAEKLTSQSLAVKSAGWAEAALKQKAGIIKMIFFMIYILIDHNELIK